MRDKDPWWHQYCLALILLLGFLLLTFVFKFLYKSSQSLLITSLLLSYGAYGSLRFIFTNEIMRRVWVKTKLSYEESEKIAKQLGRGKDYEKIPAPLDNRIREPFKWAPKYIGVLEGITYTSAIVFNQFGLIAVWLTFKALGEWSDSKEAGPTRIRANNFVIGNGISLITGVIGGIVFWLFYNSTVIIRSIENAYGVVK